MTIKINSAESVPIMRCAECDRIIPGDSPLQHCDRCRAIYVRSRAYLEKYSARVRGGWLPDRTTPAPLTAFVNSEAWITAGDLADFNHEWQRARFVVSLHNMYIFAAFRYGYGFDKAGTVVLVCGGGICPIKYFVVDESAMLVLWTPANDSDTWAERKYGPVKTAREYVYTAAFTIGGGAMRIASEHAGNENVMPVRLSVTYYAGDVRLATATSSFNRKLGQRKIKIITFFDITLIADPAGVWGFTDALRGMANHLGMLAKAPKGW